MSVYDAIEWRIYLIVMSIQSFNTHAQLHQPLNCCFLIMHYWYV